MNGEPDPAEGMRVVPSSGGAVIHLSPSALRRMKAALKRGELTFVRLGPIMEELAKSLQALQSVVPPPGTGMRLDPAFSPGPLDHDFVRGEDSEWCGYSGGVAGWTCGRQEADHSA